MNNKRSSRNKESVTESPFFTSRRYIVCCVIACFAIVSFVYNRSDSTDESSTETPIIPLATTFPALHPSMIYQDLAIEAPQSRTLKGVDESTGQVIDPTFLADVLPLKVVKILPSTESVNRNSDPVQLQGRTALVVVFNRAVIPLGGDWGQHSEDLTKAPFVLEGLSAIPGKFHWVTTSVARFDPDIDWPTDHQFILKIKEDIKSYDGTPLTITNNTILSQQYETPGMTMRIHHVHSPKTLNLTDGLWEARGRGEVPEVPPDAKITLHFSHSIDHDMVHQSLQIFEKNLHTTVDFESTNCGDRCMLLTLKTELSVDTNYEIQLPRGSKYHPFAGKLRESTTADFMGLHSFKFPFTAPRPAANRFHLWLRHGLHSSVTMEDFQKAITVSENDITLPASSWSLDRPRAAVLRITGNFKPNTQYKISVEKNSNILDGYGLSLQECETTFTTEGLPDYWIQPQGSVFESDFSADWEFFVRRGEDKHCTGVSLENINQDNMEKILEEFYYREHNHEKAKSHPNFKPFPATSANTVVSFNNSDVFGKSGAAFSSVFCDWGTKSILTRTDYAVSLTALDDFTWTAWVTSMSSGLPIAGATVTVYSVEIWEHFLVNKIASAQTGSDGIAVLNRPTDPEGKPTLVISKGDSLLILGGVPETFSHDPSSYQASIFTDRSMYRVGETVHVKGYINKFDKESLSYMADSSLQTGTISLFWNRDRVSATVHIDPEFGSFNVSLKIPYTAPYGTVSLYLQATGPKQPISTSVLLTIADPRLPTSVLDFTIEGSTFKPQLNEIPISIEITSYTGNPIPDAEVTLRWAIQRNLEWSRESHWKDNLDQEIFGLGLMPSAQEVTDDAKTTEKDQGSMVIQTNASGKADLKFVLPAELLSGPVTDEDTIDFEVEWIGPTREILTQSLSRRVAHSDWKLGVQLSTQEVVPGYPLDVSVRLLDATQADKAVEGKEVQLNLYEWDGKTLATDPANGAVNLPFPKVAEFKVISSDQRITFTLSEPRQYVLIATTTDPSSYSVVTAVPIGKSLADWKNRPLGHLPTSQVVWADKEAYEIGDTAKLTFNVPHDGRVLVFWGNQMKTQTLQQPVQAGKATIDIPVGQECHPDGCTVDIILSVPRDKNASLPVQIPTSPLLDLGIPKQIQFQKVIRVNERLPQVHIDIKPESEVVRPGSTTQIEVSLTSEKHQPVSGELTLWLLDKSIYDLQPAPPSNFTEHFHNSFKDVNRKTSTYLNYLVSEKALKNARQIILRRMGMDHWIRPSWDLTSPSELEMDDEEYFALHFEQLTHFPGHTPRYHHGRFKNEMSNHFASYSESMHTRTTSGFATTGTFYHQSRVLAGTPGVVLLGASGEEDLSPSPALRISSNFVATPVFLANIKVDSSGKTKVPVTLPDNIGTFKIFATAVSAENRTSLRYGIGQSEIISRQPLSIQPSVPRIARLGDKFQAGITVTITEPAVDSSQVKVLASIKQDTNVQLKNEEFKTVTVTQTQPVEIVFDFEAIQLGDAVIQFTAQMISGSKFSDALEIIIPILALQEPVFIATSFALDGKPAAPASSQEGIKLPPAVPGSGNVTIEAGVGRLPGIMVISDGIFHMAEHYETGATLLSALAPRAALQAYAGDQDKDRVAREYSKSIEKVTEYTTTKVGLRYFTPRVEYGYASSPSLFLNGIALLQSKLMQKVSDVVIPSRLTDSWSQAFQIALADSINRSNSTPVFWISVFHYVYGPNAELSGLSNSSVNFSSLVSKLDESSCDITCKSVVALTILDNSMNSHFSTLNDIVAYLESSIRIQGRTAYVTYNPVNGSRGAAGLLHNALALWTLSSYNYNTKASLNNLIEKLANYLASTAGSHGFYATDSAIVALSLCNYDLLKGSTYPNVKLIAQSGNNVLLSEVFDSPNHPIVKTQHSWEILSDTIDFDAIGQGEVSVALGLSFTPSELFNTSIYRGIYVQKTIQLINPFTHEPIGEHLTEVSTGKIVKVTIQITILDDISVVLIDPVPAGLEPVDPNTCPSAGMKLQYEGFSSCGNEDFWWCSWHAFPQQETMKDKVKFTSTSLRAGTHSVSYEALAVTSGTFTLPPSNAFVLDQPEVMGLSAAGTLIVKERQL